MSGAPVATILVHGPIEIDSERSDPAVCGSTVPPERGRRPGGRVVIRQFKLWPGELQYVLPGRRVLPRFLPRVSRFQIPVAIPSHQ